MAYAAGTLNEALSVVVASHVAWCPNCQKEVRRHEETGGAMIDRIDAVPVKGDCLKSVMDRIGACEERKITRQPSKATTAAHELGLPRPLCRLLGTSLDHIRWRKIAPGVSVQEIALAPASHGKLMLMKIAAGRAMPRHTHRAGEMTLVLRGSYHDQLGRFGMGDIADLGSDVEHRPVVGKDMDCICLVALEEPLKFSGIFLRLAQPFFRI